MTPPPGPSLADRLLRGARGKADRLLPVLSVLAVLLFLASLVLHLVVADLAGGSSASLAPPGATERGRMLAQSLRSRTLDATLARLAEHLPPGVALAEASDDGDTLTIAIDTRDPDALRATFAADPLLARFVARGQSLRDDGTIRALFTAAAS